MINIWKCTAHRLYSFSNLRLPKGQRNLKFGTPQFPPTLRNGWWFIREGKAIRAIVFSVKPLVILHPAKGLLPCMHYLVTMFLLYPSIYCTVSKSPKIVCTYVLYRLYAHCKTQNLHKTRQDLLASPRNNRIARRFFFTCFKCRWFDLDDRLQMIYPYVGWFRALIRRRRLENYSRRCQHQN